MPPSPSQPNPRPPKPQVAPLADDHAQRERFENHELALVLSHYDLGVIESLRVFPRGSRRSPKVRIRSKRGEYLLKRRAAGQDDPFRVAFAHDLQLRLEAERYPVAGLIGTRDDNNSMLQWGSRTYEIFNYVVGSRSGGSPGELFAVGAALGQMHRILATHRSSYQGAGGTYHAAAEIDAKISLLTPSILASEPHVDHEAIANAAEYLRRAYLDAAQRVTDLGFSDWQRLPVHGDWHPGNLLFHNSRLAAVLDFDSSRLEPRAVDLANAALQFSMHLGLPEQPAAWPEGLDVTAMHQVLRGYDQAVGRPLSPQERQSVPWLMIEALIIEGVIPIAATGSFARIAGSAFLHMIERKVRWIRPRAAKLAQLAAP